MEIDRTHLNSKYNTIIGCIYRPPSYSLKSFNELLTSQLSILHNEKKQLYIAGDFNVNTDPLVKNDINTQTFKNIFSSNFLFPLIDKPTRVTCHSATIIGNIFSNASDIANTSEVTYYVYLFLIIMLYSVLIQVLMSKLINKL